MVGQWQNDLQQASTMLDRITQMHTSARQENARLCEQLRALELANENASRDLANMAAKHEQMIGEAKARETKLGEEKQKAEEECKVLAEEMSRQAEQVRE